MTSALGPEPPQLSVPCELLPWDSAFFGRRIARVKGNRLDSQILRATESWCAGERIDCLYFLADSGDPPTSLLAEDNGFRLTDVRVTMIADAPFPAASAAGVGPARPEDLGRLRAIAAASHTNTRFFADPHFPRERCAELYATWIERSLDGFAQTVLVARAGDAAQGYVTCELDSNQGGAIGLVAVAPEARRRGLGRALLGGALAWLAAAGAREVRTVTQGRNAATQRLNQACGFTTRSVELWFHRWFPRPGEKG